MFENTGEKKTTLILQNSKTKKLVAVYMVLSMLLSVGVPFACAEPSYQPGTYTADAFGRNGTVTMTATFSENAITDIHLDVSQETREVIGQNASEELVSQFLSAQSSDIDGITGGTVTSDAAKECMADCIKQASLGEVSADLNEKACPKCGTVVSATSNFCPNCGTDLKNTDSATLGTRTGTAGSGNMKVDFGDGIIIAENDYVTVKLISFYEEEVNWAKTGKAIEKNIELKATNKSENRYIFNIEECYIGDDSVTSVMKDGNTGPKPGKSNIYRYDIKQKTSSDNIPLDNLDDLFDFEGTVSLLIYTADESRIDHTEKIDFSLSNILNAESISGSGTVAVDSLSTTVSEIDSALQGAWSLLDGKITFREGRIGIQRAGQLLAGTYTINSKDSTIDAALKTDDGTLKVHLPYEYYNGELHVFNNHGGEMIKEN